MGVISFVRIEGTASRQFSAVFSIILGVVFAMWIINNAGLGPAPGANELARFLAKACVCFSVIALIVWLFDQLVVRFIKVRH